MSDRSIVEYTAEHGGYRCGYCHSSNTNYSHGMWAHRLSVEDYQDLIDRGWRRSGKYTYKPTMNLTCCPQYPIRCAVADLQLSKSQKKAIKRVNRYLSYGIHPRDGGGGAVTDREEQGHDMEMNAAAAQKRHREQVADVGTELLVNDTCGESDKARPCDDVVKRSGDIDKSNDTLISTASCGQNVQQKAKSLPKPGVGRDPSKPLAKKAKMLRMERKQAKLMKASGGATGTVDAAEDHSESVRGKEKKPKQQKTLEDYLNDVIDKPAHTLEIVLKQSRATTSESYDVYRKYQMNVHGDSECDCSEFTYQSFLVDSPLSEPQHLAANNLPAGYGSFHQHYVLDGKIIAVGVIDILPRCVSSVYFYYDPDYAFLSLGTYSALRELAFTRFLHELEPSIAYYYLGFYIHSCPKMKYKGQYVPSFLCCPETYKWCCLEECQRKLDVEKYCRFAPPDAVDEDRLEDVDDVMCLHERTAMPYGMLYRKMKPKSTADHNREEVAQYAGFVGAACAQRMLLYRP